MALMDNVANTGMGEAGKIHFNANQFDAWSKGVLNCLDGDSNSVRSCSKKLAEQIEILVQPGVWSGAALKTNYNNFFNAHKALITFVNTFGDKYKEAMNEVNKSMALLETTNLGVNPDASNYGNLNYSAIENRIQAVSVNEEDITYDYYKIKEIAGELKKIKNTLDEVFSKMEKKISSLTDGAMTGKKANDSVSELNLCVKINYKDIADALDICISNIMTSAENAESANS